MSTNRTRPTRRGWHYDGSPATLGPDGRKTCRWCRGPVAPPKRSFCSEACVHEWKLRSDPNYLRRLVYARDRGVCALCGAHASWTGWAADHIVPVSEGGGECGLDNMRTLCNPCHNAETAALARRRAEARKGARCNP